MSGRSETIDRNVGPFRNAHYSRFALHMFAYSERPDITPCMNSNASISLIFNDLTLLLVQIKIFVISIQCLVYRRRSGTRRFIASAA